MPRPSACAYVSSTDNRRCSLPAWRHSAQGFCIGHAREIEKPKPLLLKILQHKIAKQDYDFDGFLFPFRLNLTNYQFDDSVHFTNCTFLKGVRFHAVLFEGSRLSFERSFFWGGSLDFSRCRFHSQETSFANSILEGEQAAFLHCEFSSPETNFDDLQWNAIRTIAFHQCRLTGSVFSLQGSDLRAEAISFSGNEMAVHHFKVVQTEWNATRFFFVKNRQTAGQMVFQESNWNAERMDFTQTRWNGERALFRKCAWKGGSFHFGTGSEIASPQTWEHCRWDTDRIDYSHLRILAPEFEFNRNRLSAKATIDFSHLSVDHRFHSTDSTFQSPEILWKNAKTSGDLFLFQKNRLEGELIDFSGSHFLSQQASFSRTQMQAPTIDFSKCRYQNAHTSFQAMQFKGNEVSFANAHYLSRRISFNLSRMDIDKIVFDSGRLDSSHLSFWKTRFGGASVSFRNMTATKARIVFPEEISHLHLQGSRLSHGVFDHVQWPQTGMFQRRCLADEPALLENHNYQELRRLYHWVADQYAANGNRKRQSDFLFSAREIERLELLHQRKFAKAARMECSRWTAGYGLGFSKIGVVKGCAVLLTSLFLFLDRYR